MSLINQLCYAFHYRNSYSPDTLHI